MSSRSSHRSRKALPARLMPVRPLNVPFGHLQPAGRAPQILAFRLVPVMRRRSAESASGSDSPFRFIGLFGHCATTNQLGHTPSTPRSAYTIPPLRHATPTICPSDSLPMSQARWPIDNLVMPSPPEDCFDVALLAVALGTSALGGRRSRCVRRLCKTLPRRSQRQ